MNNRLKKYIHSLPARLVLAVVVLGLAMAAKSLLGDKEGPAPSPVGGPSVSMDALYPEQAQQAIEAKVARQPPAQSPAK